MSDCAYIFLDESGNFDFKPGGTRYFVMTSVSMLRPFPICEALDSYKHHCLEDGLDLEYFHCAEDSWRVRESVFDRIADHLGEIRIDCLVVDKSETDPGRGGEKRLYHETLTRLLKDVVPREWKAGAEKIVAITDTIPVKNPKKAIEKGVKNSLAEDLPGTVKYKILHHSSRSHYGLQVADYCCWAMFRKWERKETRYYELVSDALRSETHATEKNEETKNDLPDYSVAGEAPLGPCHRGGTFVNSLTPARAEFKWA